MNVSPLHTHCSGRRHVFPGRLKSQAAHTSSDTMDGGWGAGRRRSRKADEQAGRQAGRHRSRQAGRQGDKRRSRQQNAAQMHE